MLALIVAAFLAVPEPVADPGLASKIHHLDAAFSDAAPASDAAEIRKIFTERGLPTIAMVGADAAEEFLVLTAHEQAPEFMRQVLAAAARAAATVPPHAVLFLRARVKQKAIESGLHPPYPNAALATRLNTLYTDDQAVRKGDRFDPTKMRETDARPGQEVRAIFRASGVPTRSSVGPEAARQFVVMVQHRPPISDAPCSRSCVSTWIAARRIRPTTP
jgi:hypothetical protein